jgi:TonB family protein
MKLLQPMVLVLFLLASGHAQGSPVVFISSLQMPCYPPLARQAKLEGETKVNIEVDKDGHVISAEAAEGNPLLAQASIANIRTWALAAGPGQNLSLIFKTTVTFKYKLEGEPGFDRCAKHVLFDAFNQVQITASPPVQLNTPIKRRLGAPANH